MGLDRKAYKRWKFKQDLIDFFVNEYGISDSDLRYLPEAIKFIKNEKAYRDAKPVEDKKPSETPTVKEEIKTVPPITPEQFVAAFAGEVEEFYEDGRSGKN